MIVFQQSYKVFYFFLAEQFRAREFKDIEGAENFKISRGLWGRLVGQEKVPRSHRITDKSDNAEVYYRAFTDANGSTSKTAKISDLVMIDGLKYLGLYIPISVFNEYDLEEQYELQAKILYQMFFEKYNQKIIEIDPRLKFFKLEADKVTNIFEQKPLKYKFINPTGIKKKSAEPFQVLDLQEKIINCIQLFYGHLGKEEYLEAYDFLTADYKTLFKRKVSYFIQGYTWSLAFKDIHVWDIKVVNNQAVCKVYFEEDINIYDAFDSLNITSFQNRNIRSFYLWTESFQVSGLYNEQFHLDITDQEEAKKMLNSWLETSNNKAVTFDFLRPKSENILIKSFRRLYAMDLVKRDNDWFINSIKSVRDF